MILESGMRNHERTGPASGKDWGREMRDAGYGIRDAGYGIRDAGYGMRDAGCGLRDAGCVVGVVSIRVVFVLREKIRGILWEMKLVIK